MATRWTPSLKSWWRISLPKVKKGGRQRLRRRGRERIRGGKEESRGARGKKEKGMKRDKSDGGERGKEGGKGVRQAPPYRRQVSHLPPSVPTSRPPPRPPSLLRTELLARLAPTLRALFFPCAGVPLPFLAHCASVHPHLSVHNLHHNAPPTAEMGLTLLLAAAKCLLPADAQLRRGDWRAGGGPSLNVTMREEAAGVCIPGSARRGA